MKKLIDVMSQKCINENLNCEYRIIACPCCGNETFDMYFICPHCGWEYDGIINDDDYSSANDMTLKEYRAQYKVTKNNNV